jgi:hypothetical protein
MPRLTNDAVVTRAMVSVRLTTDSWVRDITPEKEQPIIKNYYFRGQNNKDKQ